MLTSLEKCFGTGRCTWDSMGIVLGDFPLLFIKMGLAHFLKYDPLSIWALALNQVHSPHIYNKKNAKVTTNLII